MSSSAGISDNTDSLTKGKAADIIATDGNTSAMRCTSEHDPVAAVVRHVGVREIETVTVAGMISRKIAVWLTSPSDTRMSGMAVRIPLPYSTVDSFLGRLLQNV